MLAKLVARIPSELREAFSSRSRARGEELFRSGRVEIEERTERLILASVQGGALYRVRIERDVRPGRMAALACSCPFVLLDEEPCKHLWAALLAATIHVDFRLWSPLGGKSTRPWRPGPAKVSLSWNGAGGAGTATARGGVDESALAEAERASADEIELSRVLEESRSARAHPFEESFDLEDPLLDPMTEAVAPPRPDDWLRGVGFVAEALTRRSDLPLWPSGRRLEYRLDADAARRSNQPRLAVLAADLRKDGTYAAARTLHLDRREIEVVTEPLDRALLAALAGASPVDPYPSWRDAAPTTQLFDLQPEALRELAPRLAATGRFRLAADRDSRLSRALEWSDEPWRFALRIQPAEGEPDAYEVTGALRREASTLSLAEPWVLLAGAVAAGDGWIAPFQDGGAFPWIGLLRSVGRLRIPRGEIDAALEAIHRLPAVPNLELPPDLTLAEEVGRPRPSLRIEIRTPTPWSSQRPPLALRLELRYGGARIEAADPRGQVLDAPARRLLRRDRALEETFRGRLLELGARTPPRSRARENALELSSKEMPRLTRALLAEDWEVVADGAVIKRASTPNLRVSSGIDWFELEGGVEFGEERVALPVLLAALARGHSTVQLGDGSFGLLPEEWLEKHQLWLELGEATGETLRFAKAQAPLVAAFLEEEAAIAETDASFRRLRERLEGGARISASKSTAAPQSFRGELRDYQRTGLGWLRFLAEAGLGGCLADEMGLGKTVQILALLAGRKRPEGTVASLVVAPRSLLFNWRAETERFAPKLSVAEHHGGRRGRDAESFAGADLVLTTYDLLRRDTELLAAVEWDVVVLDEAQAIKNADTATARATRRLRARVRLASTGTPVENHLGELWSLFEFLNPGLFTRSRLLREASGRELPPATREKLARALHPFLLRRTKRQVAPELPERTEQTLGCDLDPKQRRLYDELRDHYRVDLGRQIDRRGLKRSGILVIQALLRLRQAACHPGLLQPGLRAHGGAKFEVLLPRLAELAEEGQKALVFSQFTSLLALLRPELERQGIGYEYLDGSTTDREAPIESFSTDPGKSAFLISLKAGGTGLNLTAAEYVFLLDPWWNPAVEAQAIDRTHRIGQTRPVFAYRLIARDTVEERILELQAAKRDLADAILGAQSGPLAALTREDLDLLLS